MLAAHALNSSDSTPLCFSHLGLSFVPLTQRARYEYRCEKGDPFYRAQRAENQQLFKMYERLANSLSKVTFICRSAIYCYYTTDQVVGQALSAFKRTVEQSIEHGSKADRTAALEPRA